MWAVVDIQQKIVGNVEIMLVYAMGTVLGKINDAFWLCIITSLHVLRLVSLLLVNQGNKLPEFNQFTDRYLNHDHNLTITNTKHSYPTSQGIEFLEEAKGSYFYDQCVWCKLKWFATVAVILYPRFIVYNRNSRTAVCFYLLVNKRNKLVYIMSW